MLPVEKEAFDTGYGSFKCGLDWNDNPYAYGTPRYDATKSLFWSRGWEQAEKDDESGALG